MRWQVFDNNSQSSASEKTQAQLVASIVVLFETDSQSHFADTKTPQNIRKALSSRSGHVTMSFGTSSYDIRGENIMARPFIINGPRAIDKELVPFAIGS